MINWYLDDIAVNGRCAYLDNDDIRVTMPVADLGGAPGAPPLRPKMFSFSCSFSENMAKSYVGASPWRVGTPPMGILDPPLHATYM